VPKITLNTVSRLDLLYNVQQKSRQEPRSSRCQSVTVFAVHVMARSPTQREGWSRGSSGDDDTYDYLLYCTFYRFTVKSLRPLFVGGTIQIHFDWLIDWLTDWYCCIGRWYRYTNHCNICHRLAAILNLNFDYLYIWGKGAYWWCWRGRYWVLIVVHTTQLYEFMYVTVCTDNL